MIANEINKRTSPRDISLQQIRRLKPPEKAFSFSDLPPFFHDDRHAWDEHEFPEWHFVRENTCDKQAMSGV